MRHKFNEDELDTIVALIEGVEDKYFTGVAMLVWSLPPNLRDQVQDALLSRVDKSEVDETKFVM